MPRWRYPQDRTVFVHTGPLLPILEPKHHAIALYEDPECTTLANVASLDGAIITDSLIYTDENGLLPEFYGPMDTLTVYARPLGQFQVTPVEAIYGPRIAQLIDEVEGHGGSDTTTLLTGEGPPGPGSGTEGDMYLDTLAYVLYGPKMAEGWPTSGQDLIVPPEDMKFSYVHDQAVPEAVWAIQHDLGYYPNVTVVDSAGSVVVGEVSYLDLQSVEIVFVSAFGGKAYLS